MQGLMHDKQIFIFRVWRKWKRLDFTKENSEMLRKMLQNRHPDYVIMNDWKNQIFETLSESLRKEGFTDEQIRKVARAVWVAFDM